MSTRRPSRKTARRRPASTIRARAEKLLYHRALRQEPLEDRRLLALVTVDTLADTIDSGDGLTSLREAIVATNSAPGADTIDCAPALTAGGPATILLTHGELKITDDVTIIGLGSDLLTIDARGNDPTPDRDDGDGTRVLNIDDADASSMLNVSISGLIFTGGDIYGSGGAIRSTEALRLAGSKVTGNSAGSSHVPQNYGGGGIFSSGILELTNCTVSNNSLMLGPGYGCGVFSLGTRLTITGSTISNNHANIVSIRGGGVFSGAVETFVSDSHFTANHIDGTTSVGAGLYCDGATLSIEQTAFSENDVRGTGAAAGAVFTRSATTTIADCLVTKNHVQGTSASGGGISGGGGQLTITTTSILDNEVRGTSSIGGGIVSTASMLYMSNCTISGNSTDSGSGDGGGGIWIRMFTADGSARVSHTTIVGNSSADGGGVFVRNARVTLDHTIVANNRSE